MSKKKAAAAVTGEIEGPPVQWRGSIETTRVTEAALDATGATTLNKAIITQEKLIGENNLRPIAFLSVGLERASSVAQVVVPGFGTATGFLVAPGLLLTNNHVLPDADLAARAEARFNYQLDDGGQLLPSANYHCRPETFFMTDPTLDYALVAVEGDPGLRFGVIAVVPVELAVGAGVNIIQHPGGQPKQIALVDNEVAYCDDDVVQYLTDTLPGSSGAPVFDDQWRLVALHHSGGWIPEPSSQSTHFRNEGISVTALLKAWRAAGIAA
jgi:hypothetical protein